MNIEGQEDAVQDKRITRAQARADYIAMGTERSIAKLVRALEKDGIILKRRTVALWCSKYGWVAAAEEHDSQVAGEVSRKAIEAEAEATWDAAKDLMVIAEVGAKRLKACLAVCEGSDGPTAKALAEVVIALLKHAGEMTGQQPAAGETRLDVDQAADNIIDLLDARRKARKRADEERDRLH